MGRQVAVAEKRLQAIEDNERNEAAKIMQARARGFLTRARVKKIMAKKLAEKEERRVERKARYKAQARDDRERYLAEKEASRKAEAEATRRRLEQIEKRRQTAAVKRIQARVRGWLGRRNFPLLKKKAEKAKAEHRAWLEATRQERRELTAAKV